MKTRTILLAAILGVIFAQAGGAQTKSPADALPAPGFHHLHLNSMDPDAAIEFYGKDVPPVSDLFGKLAEDWRGWEGERVWGPQF